MRLIDTTETPDRLQEKELHDRRRRFQLARLITLSEEMLEHARDGGWEQVEALELQRRVELEECFALQNEHPSLLIAQALATLIHINDQMVSLVRQARDLVSTEHTLGYRSHQAAMTYQLGKE